MRAGDGSRPGPTSTKAGSLQVIGGFVGSSAIATGTPTRAPPTNWTRCLGGPRRSPRASPPRRCRTGTPRAASANAPRPCCPRPSTWWAPPTRSARCCGRPWSCPIRRPCAGPGCDRTIPTASTGRPRLYCGDACRQRARRARPTTQTTADDRAALEAVLAGLPADSRPGPPSVTPYDQLLHHPPSQPQQAPQPRAGQDWDDGDVCLWRDEGRWGLTGPNGDLEGPEFGLFGHGLAARDTKGAQAAAAAAKLIPPGRPRTRDRASAPDPGS